MRSAERFLRLGTFILFAGAGLDCDIEQPAPPDETEAQADVCDGENSRTRYKDSAPAPGVECESEEQSRVCVPHEDGSYWAPSQGTEYDSTNPDGWSGTFDATKCTESAAARCGDAVHGEEETRDRYESALVVSNEGSGNCVKEAQSRSCDNGMWTTWSGSYEEEACQVLCAEGTEQSRTRFKADNGICLSETQIRECEEGLWLAWSGSFTDTSCGANQPARCTRNDGSAVGAGGVEERQLFQSTSVEFGEPCVSEEQQRTCAEDGWGAWSGTFEEESCEVGTPLDCGDEFPHGSAVSRTRYESESVPSGGTCTSEMQFQSCTHGVVSEWSGTFTYESCEVEASLMSRCEESPGLCFDALVDTAALDALCSFSSEAGACADIGLDFFGNCSFDDDAHPAGYVEYYVNWDGPMGSETECTNAGGSYTPTDGPL